MKTLFLFLTFLLFAFFPCCRKDSSVTVYADPPSTTNHTSSQEPRNNYLPLKVGNYWIYSHFSIFDSTFQDDRWTDSVVVEKDTVIFGKVFYKVYGFSTTRPWNYLTFYNNYLIDEKTMYYFSSEDFTSVLRTNTQLDVNGETMAWGEFRMRCRDSLITVPAGTFTTITALCTYSIAPDYQNINSENPKFEFHCFAKNIGCV